MINADPDAWYRSDPADLGEENYADHRRAIHNPDTVHPMLKDYRAGLGIDRAHDDADRAAGRTVRCPTLVLWASRDDLVDLHGDVLAIWQAWAPDLARWPETPTRLPAVRVYVGPLENRCTGRPPASDDRPVTVIDLSTRRAGSAAQRSPVVLAVHESHTPADVVDVVLLDAFCTGAEPYAHSMAVPRPRPDVPLHPRSARLLHSAVTVSGYQVHLYGGNGWTLRVARGRDGGAELTVTAVTEELAEQVLAEATDGASLPEPPRDEAVEIGFWHAGNGYVRRQRPITATPWEAVRANYASRAATALDTLMSLTSADVRGRLLLLYGPPGTGKTTVLRTLAQRWRDWCQVDCVLDPERLFSDPGYLMEVAVGVRGDQSGTAPRWRLLLLEDCDELIGGGARHASGQALSRLLNLTDGMLGQGREVLVAITTNEDITRLHPAVTRPGRCLARIELGPLPYPQACRWLGRADGVPAAGATRAELYALRDGTEPVAVTAPGPAAGQYL